MTERQFRNFWRLAAVGVVILGLRWGFTLESAIILFPVALQEILLLKRAR